MTIKELENLPIGTKVRRISTFTDIEYITASEPYYAAGHLCVRTTENEIRWLNMGYSVYSIIPTQIKLKLKQL